MAELESDSSHRRLSRVTSGISRSEVSIARCRLHAVLGPLFLPRIKAWLLATRHTVRDYLDTVVLLERLGEAAAPVAFARFDELYPQAGGASALSEVVERLAAAAPSDAPAVDLRSYKGLVAPWNDWAHLAARGRHWASVLARAHLSGGRP